jgi:nucleoid DNA-binding protein
MVKASQKRNIRRLSLGRPATPSGVHFYTDLAREIQELLGMPLERAGYARNPRQRQPRTGRRIVQAIQQVITEALLRGESVQVKGFGTFAVETRPAWKVPRGFLQVSSDGDILANSATPQTIPPKRVVTFRPSPSLMLHVNRGRASNWKQRQLRREST